MKLAALALLLALASSPALAAVDLNEAEFRLFCGYLDEINKPEIAKLSGPKRDKAIATKAKVKPAVLTAAVAKGTKAGATCDEVGKLVEADAKKAVEAALPGRIVVFNFDFTDPS